MQDYARAIQRSAAALKKFQIEAVKLALEYIDLDASNYQQCEKLAMQNPHLAKEIMQDDNKAYMSTKGDKREVKFTRE